MSDTLHPQSAQTGYEDGRFYRLITLILGLKAVLMGTLLGLAVFGQHLGTDTKVLVLDVLIVIVLAGIVIGPLAIYGRKAILPMVATFVFATLAVAGLEALIRTLL